jgi:hypothetical protein
MSISNNNLNRDYVVFETTFKIEQTQTVRKFVENKSASENGHILNFCSEINFKTKGVADGFALIGRSFKFITPYVTENVADWTDHVSNFTLKARGALSVPFMWTAVKRFNEKITFRSICELAATALHSGALFVLDVASKTLSSIGSMFKVLVDCHDFYDNAKKFTKTRELCNLANEGGASDEVKSGLNSQWYEQLFKIFKFTLAAIAGLAAGFVFCSGVALPAALGVAILAGSIVSVIFSIAADYVMETAMYVEFNA